MYYLRLVLWFLGIAAFILIVVAIFGGGKPAPVNPVKPLPEYADTDATVSLTIDGMVNGDELHRQIRITVGANQRSLDIIQGYSNQVIKSKDFYNTGDAYTVFLKAINNEGFLAKIKNPKVSDDERGLCPLGNRYIFDLNLDGDDLSRTWTSSCGRSIGTSSGALDTLLALFQGQIPDYQTLTQDVNLSAVSTQQ